MYLCLCILGSDLTDKSLCICNKPGVSTNMGQPKKQTTKRRRGNRRSHIVLKLARRVNGKSPVKVRTTVRESGAAKK